jgi:hypothetical protein
MAMPQLAPADRKRALIVRRLLVLAGAYAVAAAAWLVVLVQSCSEAL